jgi:hypothetical protein
LLSLSATSLYHCILLVRQQLRAGLPSLYQNVIFPCLVCFSTLWVETAHAIETLVTICQTTWHYIVSERSV